MKKNENYGRIEHGMKQQAVVCGQLINYYVCDKEKSNNLIFLHGWRSSAEAWNGIIPNVKDASVFALDLPGFGGSSLPKHPFSVTDYSNIVAEFIKSKNLKNVILVGHSVGGRIAIKLASTFPELIDKLVLVDSAGFISVAEQKRKAYKFIAIAAKPIFKPKFMQGLRKKIYKAIGSEDYVETPELNSTYLNIVKEDLSIHLPQIKAKTLIIWGDKDRETPIDFAEKMNREIKNSKLVVLKDAGHFSFIDKPDEFVRELTEFIGNK